MIGKMNLRELVSEITKSSEFYKVLSVPSGPAPWACSLHSHLGRPADKDSMLILTLYSQCLAILNFIFALGLHQSLGQWSMHTSRNHMHSGGNACTQQWSSSSLWSMWRLRHRKWQPRSNWPRVRATPRDSPKLWGMGESQSGTRSQMVVVIVAGMLAQQ